MSPVVSAPTSVAVAVVPSLKRTDSEVASATTWLLVRM